MTVRHQRPGVRVGKTRRIALYVIGLGTWLSGGCWLLLHYFFTKKGEFGPQPHPLEPWSLRLHGAFAFGALWIFGLFWGIHVQAAWPRHRRRASGVAVTSAFVLLIATGYLLYYVGDDERRNLISILHWSIGLLAPLSYVWHRWRRRRTHIAPRATAVLQTSPPARPAVSANPHPAATPGP